MNKNPGILITGSGRRIGAKLALKYAEKGYNVAVHYGSSRDKAESLAQNIINSGGNCIVLRADLREPAQIKKMFEQIPDEFNLNVLINNAGVFPLPQKINDIEEQDWDNVFDVNLKAAFICSKYFAQKIESNGRIINIASTGGLEIWKNRIPYNVSKSAVINLTKATARELAPKISVNCICPGTILIEDDPADDPFLQAVDKIPMNRYGSTDDIFEAAYFFSTATNYITGQILSVDGGSTLIK